MIRSQEKIKHPLKGKAKMPFIHNPSGPCLGCLVTFSKDCKTGLLFGYSVTKLKSKCNLKYFFPESCISFCLVQLITVQECCSCLQHQLQL